MNLHPGHSHPQPNRHERHFHKRNNAALAPAPALALGRGLQAIASFPQPVSPIILIVQQTSSLTLIIILLLDVFVLDVDIFGNTIFFVFGRVLGSLFSGGGGGGFLGTGTAFLAQDADG